MPPSAATGLSFSLAGVFWSFVLLEAAAVLLLVVLLEAAAASPAAGLALKKEVIISDGERRRPEFPRVGEKREETASCLQPP